MAAASPASAECVVPRLHGMRRPPPPRNIIPRRYAAARDRRRAAEGLDDCGFDPFDPFGTNPDDCVEDEMASPIDAEAFARDACADLVKAGRRFVNKELEITHKQLIKEQRAAGGKKFSPTVQEALAEDKARTAAILAERRRLREAKQKELDDLYNPWLAG